MNKTIECVENVGIVPVIAIPDVESACPLAMALERGGIPLMEVTFRNAHAAACILAVKKRYPDMIVGAGTILATEQVDAALAAGADFIVAPGLNPEVVEYCGKKETLILPGCVTPTEIEAGRKLGLRLFKFFPSEQHGGVKTVAELCGPYRDVKFIPTSGITLQNLPDYMACDKVAAVGGSFMAPASFVAAGEWEKITERCKLAVRTALNFRLIHVGVNGTRDEGEARAKRFAEIFDLPCRQGGRSDFAGDIFESGKIRFPGENGHIAIGTPSLERAAAFLKKRGVAFREEFKLTDENGRLVALYLEEEIGGFAIHLLRK